MADQSQAKPPLHQQYLERLKSYRIVAILIVIATVVTAVASFTDAAKKLAASFQTPQPVEAREQLTRLGIAYTQEAFLTAAWKGDKDAVKLFIKAGMPVNEIQEQRIATPLIAAVTGNRPEVAELLVKAGADPALHASRESSALDLAAASGDLRLARILLGGKAVGKAAVDSALLEAAATCRPEMMGLLQAHGGDLKALATPALQRAAATRIHYADAKAISDTLNLLLQAGADIEARSGDSNWTPLHSASFSADASTVRVLLDHGAAVEARDRDGGTPLWWAAGVGHLESAELLLSKGADPNVHDKDGTTVLSRAKYNQDAAMIKLLRAKGAR